MIPNAFLLYFYYNIFFYYVNILLKLSIPSIYTASLHQHIDQKTIVSLLLLIICILRYLPHALLRLREHRLYLPDLIFVAHIVGKTILTV